MFQLTIKQTGVQSVRALMNSVAKSANDMRPAWPSVERTFREIEFGQFQSEGSSGESGRWPDLEETYARRKALKFPGTKILEASGRLKDSLISRTADSIVESGDQRLVLGSKVEYAIFHQESGRSKKWRPPISLTNRQAAQIAATVNRYFLDVMKQNNRSRG